MFEDISSAFNNLAHLSSLRNNSNDIFISIYIIVSRANSDYYKSRINKYFLRSLIIYLNKNAERGTSFFLFDSDKMSKLYKKRLMWYNGYFWYTKIMRNFLNLGTHMKDMKLLTYLSIISRSNLVIYPSNGLW